MFISVKMKNTHVILNSDRIIFIKNPTENGCEVILTDGVEIKTTDTMEDILEKLTEDSE